MKITIEVTPDEVLALMKKEPHGSEVPDTRELLEAVRQGFMSACESTLNKNS